MTVFDMRSSTFEIVFSHPTPRWNGFEILTDVCQGRVRVAVRCGDAVSSMVLHGRELVIADDKARAVADFIDAACEQLWSRWMAL